MNEQHPPRPPSAFRPDEAAAEARARRFSELGRPRGAVWLGALMAIGYGVANYLLGLAAIGVVREGNFGAYLGAAQHLVNFGVQVAHALHLRRKGLTRTATGLALVAAALFLPFSACWLILIEYVR
jgi:hypothetical protein